MEWMRINAERDRVNKYRQVAKQSAILYYKILKRFSEETSRYEKEKANDKNSITLDPQIKIKAIQKETELKEVLSYITGNIMHITLTDYMRIVIENGNQFNQFNLFMMFQELNP